MTREELIKKVALKMDEISSSDDIIVSINSGDNNPLYAQINSLLNESINDVLLKAPIHKIKKNIGELKSFGLGYSFCKTRKILNIQVPDDFLRLVLITDDSFQRPITELAIEGDAIDKRQRNKFLMAKTAKPVAVFGRDEENNLVITCYSLDKSTESISASGLYVKRFNGNITLSSTVDLDDYLVDIVSWACAGKVFAAQGDVAKSQICDTNALALMV